MQQPRREQVTRRRLVAALVWACAVWASAVSAQRRGGSLETLPLLEQPSIVVEGVGLQQSGRHIEIAALLTNKSGSLDAREPSVTLVGFGVNGEMTTQRTLELASIPAAMTVAVSVGIELESDARIGKVSAHVGLNDAAVQRAQPPLALTASDVAVRLDRNGQLLVTGRVAPGRNYPVAYRVDAVVVDERGAIVGSARQVDFKVGNEPTPFVARGLAAPKIDPSRVHAVVTILPGRGEP